MSIPTIQGLAGITAQPELRFTPSGTAVLGVRLAFSDRKYNEQSREWETSKSFYVDGNAWEETAVRLSELLSKGDQVYVEGRIETQQWEQDGQKRSKPVMNLRTVRKLEKGNGGASQGAQNVASQLGGQPAGNWSPKANDGGWGAPQGQQQSAAWGNGADTNTEPPF